MSRAARFIRQIHIPTVAAGVVGYVLFFVLLPSLHPDTALRGKIDSDAIHAEANEWAQALGVNPDDYHIDYATLRGGDLLSYLQQDRSLRQVTAQVRSGEIYPLPVYYQRVRYYRHVDDEELRERVMELRFLPTGGLVHLDIRDGSRISGNPRMVAAGDTSSINQPDPAGLARRHLATTAWRDLDFRVDSVAADGAREAYEVFFATDTTVVGTSPRLHMIVRADGAVERISLQGYDTEEEPEVRSASVGFQFGMSGEGGVVKAITHTVLFILLLVLFFRRLDARLVDTRGALRDSLWAGLWGLISGLLVMGQAMFGADVASSVAVIIMIVGSMFFGAVTLLLVFVASSVGDSYAREAWPDRLHALDFVRRLTIVNPYVGSAIWNGFGVAGVLLALSVIARGALRDSLWAGLWGLISGLLVMGQAMFGADVASSVAVIIMIVGSMFFGAVTLLLVFVASSVGDSYAREAWPDRLHALDFVRRLTIVNPYVGSAIWNGFGVAGVLLALSVIALGAPGSAITLGDDFLTGLSYRPFISSTADAIWFSTYVTFGVAAAVGGLVRLNWPRLAIAVPVGLMALLGIAPFAIASTGVALVYRLAVGAVVIWAFNRMGAVTTVAGLGIAYLVGSIVPNWMALPSAAAFDFVGVIALVVVLLIVGFVGASSVMRVEERAPYIPAYIIEHSEQQRLEREIEIARHVQMSFLPRAMPQVAGMDADAMCLPAYEVGGDYYDLIVLDEDRVAVVIGDVSGKGIQAAFYMTLVKGIIQTLAGSETSPLRVLSRLNKVFFDVAPRGTFITLIYGVLDFRTGRFRYARAGHHPLLVLRADETEFIRPSGMAIGFLGDDRFEDSLEEHELKLDVGDYLVLYTDGITEAVNVDHEQFGEDGLVGALKGADGTTASDMMTRLRDALDRFAAPDGRMDDMTMIVLRRVPHVVGPNGETRRALKDAAEPVAV